VNSQQPTSCHIKDSHSALKRADWLEFLAGQPEIDGLIAATNPLGGVPEDA
jgi:hypothetical protein